MAESPNSARDTSDLSAALDGLSIVADKTVNGKQTTLHDQTIAKEATSIFSEPAEQDPGLQAFNAAIQPYLPDFEKVADLGCFSFTPTGPYKDLGAVVPKDILSAVTLGAVPGELASINELNSRCPLSFRKNLPAQEYDNRFPYNPGYVVPVFAAVSGNTFTISSVDFVLGGSALNMLNKQEIDDDAKYLVQRHRNLIFVAKHSSYIQNYADPGFQFERLVCGGQFGDTHDVTHYEHLQVVKIAGFRALFSAEMDAVEKATDGIVSPVEIKCSNPRYWGHKVALQMLSSGSLSLVQGQKHRGAQLQSIRKRSLSSVFSEAGGARQWKGVQDRIVQGLSSLSSVSEKVGGLLSEARYDKCKHLLLCIADFSLYHCVILCSRTTREVCQKENYSRWCSYVGACRLSRFSVQAVILRCCRKAQWSPAYLAKC
jgi:hypothetical protein